MKDATMTPRDRVQARRSYLEMVRAYIATATAIATMSKHASAFRSAAALADLDLSPAIPDLVNIQDNTSPLNALTRAAVSAGIIRADDESIKEANWRQ